MTLDQTVRAAVLEHARRWIGTRESKRNSGQEIDRWLARVGQPAGQAWCAAWLCCVWDDACRELGLVSPVPMTASTRRLWERSPEVLRRPLPAPGDVYVLDHGGGRGHTGIVETVAPDGMVTDISGNTNELGEREGTGVFRHVWQPRDGKRGVVLGWLDFAATFEPAAVVDANGLPPSPFT